MSTAFSAIIQACAKEMSEGQWPVVSTTTADGSATELVDSKISNSDTNADVGLYKNKWVRLTISTTENIRKVKTYTLNSGTLTPTVDYSGAPGTGTEYEIHWKLHPEHLKDAIADALGEMIYVDVLPLSLQTDGEFEQATCTDYWQGTDATPSWDTSIALFGRQSLKVLDSGSGEGFAWPKAAADSGSNAYVQVSPGEQLLVWAPVYGDQKGAKLILYDVTNGADIEEARHDEEGWGLLQFTCTVPDDCYEVMPRMYTITASGATYWDHIGILKTGQRLYDCPSWVLRSQEFLSLIYLTGGNALSSDNADNAYRIWTLPLDYNDEIDIVDAQRGIIPLRLGLSSYPTKPLFVVGKRRYPSLSADTDTTMADKNTVMAGALYHAYSKLGKDYASSMRYWGDRFVRLQRGVQPRPIVRVRSPYE